LQAMLPEFHTYNLTALRILESMESSYYRASTVNQQVLEHFDVIASYETSSEIPLRYGPVPTTLFQVFHFNKEYSPPHTWATAYKYPSQDIKARKNAIAMFVSQCWPWRMKLIAELQKHLKIDAFGACFNKTGPPPSKFVAIQTYKFVVTIENAICEDYATEKLFGPLLHGAVPIYFGASKVDDLIPHPDAIVNVRRFKSAKALADHVNAMLADSDMFYNHHHAWRTSTYQGTFAKHLAATYRSQSYVCSICSYYQTWTAPAIHPDGRRLNPAKPMRPCSILAELNGTMWPNYTANL